MINILIIIMYRKITKKRKNYFQRCFENNPDVKCYFRHWKNKNLEKTIKDKKIDGIILTGSEYRILEDDKKIATLPDYIFKSNIPILGICYGFQYLIKYFGGNTHLNSFKTPIIQKYYKNLKINKPFKIPMQKYFFNHHDYIVKLPSKWKVSLKYKKIIYMAYYKKIIGIQFHPEESYKVGKIFYNIWINYIKKMSFKN